jgi:hypothetical protein
MVESPADILCAILPGPTRQESVDLAIHGLLNLKEGRATGFQHGFEKSRPRKRPSLEISCDDDSSLDSARDSERGRELPNAKRVRFEDSQPCVYPVHVNKEFLVHLKKMNMLRMFRRPSGEIMMFMTPSPATNPATNPHNPSDIIPVQTCSVPPSLHPAQPETDKQTSIAEPSVVKDDLGGHPMYVDEGSTSTEETATIEASLEQPPSSAFRESKQNPAIRLCQIVSNVVNVSSMQMVASLHGFGMRRMLNEEEILTIAEQFFGNEKAQVWRKKLQQPEPGFYRADYLKQMSRTKNPQVKVIFQLLQCCDFFFSERGQTFATGSSLEFFFRDFESTLVRSLSTRCDESENIHGTIRGRNLRLLLETLPLAYFCVSYLMTEQGVPLEHNLCQFLLLVSCLEGRGVYHYRASNNLSMAHKAYRYMIERIGGKDYGSKSLDDCERAEKELKKTFEMF